MKLIADCPICDGQVTVPEGTEKSEILSCLDCNNKVVVKEIQGSKITLEKAPEVEEDWGE